jgi:haloalkane dehalogenase
MRGINIDDNADDNADNDRQLIDLFITILAD